MVPFAFVYIEWLVKLWRAERQGEFVRRLSQLCKMSVGLKLLRLRASAKNSTNICFSLLMCCNLLFWIYVFFTPRTNAMGKEYSLDALEMKENPPLQDRPPDSGKNPRPLQVVIAPTTPKQTIPAVLKLGQFPEHDIEKPRKRYLDDVLKADSHISGQSLADYNYTKYFNRLLHHTILFRDASVIWKSTFVLNPSSLCARHSELDLLIVVHTAPYNFQRRYMLRQEIRAENFGIPYTTQLVFMIGTVGETKKNASSEILLKREFLEHRDLVQMDFIENFRNLSLKALMWVRWTNSYCSNAQMVLKIDDDVVLDMPKSLLLSRGVFSKYKKSIFCHLNKLGSQPIPRTGRTKVDPREFARMAVYPYNYCSGFLVFLTPDLIPLLESTARTIPFYNVDDVFMFGMVPKFVGGVTYHNIGYNISIWNKKVLKCNLDKGTRCSYFGTMAEEEEDRHKIWSVLRHNQQRDFHFPRMVLVS